MLITIDEFQKKYNLSDSDIPSYDDETKRIITEVLNGNIDKHANSKNSTVLFYIGKYYNNVKKDESSTEKYYLMAIEHGNISAMNNLGLLYRKQNKLELAKKYYLMAIAHDNSNQRLRSTCAIYNLGFLYDVQHDLDSAEKYYLMTVENGNNHPCAMNNLGQLYKRQNKFDLAEKYYLMAIENGNLKAMKNLGHLYDAQNKFDLAIKYYLKVLSFDANVISKIITIIPKVSQEIQLQVLELVPQIRTMNEILHIPPTVYFQFMNKTIKISRWLARYLIDDIVDICLDYY